MPFVNNIYVWIIHKKQPLNDENKQVQTYKFREIPIQYRPE